MENLSLTDKAALCTLPPSTGGETSLFPQPCFVSLLGQVLYKETSDEAYS